MKYFAASFALLVAVFAGNPADAQPPPFGRPGMEQGGGVPFGVILNNIRRQFPGQLLDVQEAGGRYQVRWLTPDGRVLFIVADARTGQIVGQGGGGPPPRNFGGFQRQNFGPGRNVDVSRQPDGNGVERPFPGRGRGRGRLRNED
jgi:hypothetical protein